ncbi:MAG: tRNA (cytidine-2'-O-)-methyltransferase TrmJ [Candidatus Argoarchaeum ethanivorans]|uniref:tRNA (Cytidine-2'-O-)-methyltransferase TrmJ n=1 Tax=Candidatus Argoarchaeum ethanivorans TaxID=2608793 RepID=A0A811TEE0_9EURY|nr:MAG: tRNA (cytidine-2'-O-)-methyltransferase TrmJ [Candidatus Argoarchaeum ethanivorans]
MVLYMSCNIGVVLVEPKFEGNIGSVARVMKNFDFPELILVNPCRTDDAARMLSVHAWDVIEHARIVSSFSESISGFDVVVGCTGIVSTNCGEHVRTPAVSPKKLVELLSPIPGKIGIVFGREDRGLDNNELAKCDIITSIPTSRDYQSMNLSHAVCVVLYELSNVTSGEVDVASGFEVDLLIEHFGKIMNESGYPGHKHDKTMLMLKRIFGRTILTAREVVTFRGILRQIQWRFK